MINRQRRSIHELPRGRRQRLDALQRESGDRDNSYRHDAPSYGVEHAIQSRVGR